ncbi:flagellar export protein FliJ [Endobacter medicaginis]|uniref:Flagellar FliJ protein n=1 Tax=Endobacter medicaginis TaxID=1181271 RepID=A0A850NNZ8_9PROT|nr:flagellar FliJ family protein [Endobacter medicaginis]MBB3174760.1 flagellar export protein FliJ [Endobacter medicaginis]MCX5475820.1 flagellar FliJ family protein [Endobacter medicaginis]NVN30109.1 flagellar FliJ family protein [Endobacter medicaginis]
MKDPLLSLLRLRKQAMDDARRMVAESLDAHHVAQHRLHLAEENLERETRAASALDAGDGAVEAFARWLHIGQAEITRCRDTEREAGGAVDRARAALGLARAAVEVVERLIASRAEAEARQAIRREQAQIDELRRRAL